MYSKEEFDNLFHSSHANYISPLQTLFWIYLASSTVWKREYLYFIGFDLSVMILVAIINKFMVRGNFRDWFAISFWNLHSLITIPIHSHYLGNSALSCLAPFLYIHGAFGSVLVLDVPFWSVMSTMTFMTVMSPVFFGGMNWNDAITYSLPTLMAIAFCRMVLVLIERFQKDQIDRERERLLLHAKGEVFRIASHELRNPLQALTYSIHYMGGLDLDSSLNEIVDDLKATATVLSGMVENVLDFNLIENNKFGLKNVSFSLIDVLSNIMDVYHLTAVKRNLQLYLWIDPLIPSQLVGDASRITQIISNYVVNALKFTETGSVEIRAECVVGKEFSIKFSCIDTGIGMKKDDVDKIFTPYTRLATTGDFSKGWGLGLSISAEIIRKMNGTFGVTSEYGKGSTFWAQIPFTEFSKKKIQDEFQITKKLEVYTHLRDEKLEDTLVGYLKSLGIPVKGTFHVGISTSTPIIVLSDTFVKDRENVTFIQVKLPLNIRKLHTSLSGSKHHDYLRDFVGLSVPSVLLVEDDEMVRKMEVRILEIISKTIQCATNGIEALELLESTKLLPSLMLVDNHMPKMNGTEFITKVKTHRIEKLRTIPIIMMSGTINQDLKDKLHEYQIMMIQKPVNPNELFQCISTVMAQQTSREEKLSI